MEDLACIIHTESKIAPLIMPAILFLYNVFYFD